MTAIVFVVLGKAQPAGSKKAFPFQRQDGRLGATVVDANPKSRGWKNDVSAAAAAAFQGELLEGPLSVEFLFEVPRPHGHFGKKGLLASAPAYPTTRPDVLKLARAVEDSLSGVLYRDDAQIVDEHIRKAYGERARLTVKVQRPWVPEAALQPSLLQPSLLEVAAVGQPGGKTDDAR